MHIHTYIHIYREREREARFCGGFTPRSYHSIKVAAVPGFRVGAGERAVPDDSDGQQGRTEQHNRTRKQYCKTCLQGQLLYNKHSDEIGRLWARAANNLTKPMPAFGCKLRLRLQELSASSWSTF